MYMHNTREKEILRKGILLCKGTTHNIITIYQYQPFLTELSSVSDDYNEELSELQQDCSDQANFKSKGQLIWLHEEVYKKYPKLTTTARCQLLPFPSSYLLECAFSTVTDMLTKKRNRLDICQRDDLRRLEPEMESLMSEKDKKNLDFVCMHCFYVGEALYIGEIFEKTSILYILRL